MLRDVLVYLSGPMTQYDPSGPSVEQNLAVGVDMHLRLLRAGVPNFCPHLCGLVPSAWSTVTHDQWLAYDEAIIDRCTHLYLLPFWTRSNGAQREFTYAHRKGLPVAYNLDQLSRMLGVALVVERG